MSLRLICGRTGTGKSEYCLKEILQNLNKTKKIYIITPEQFSYEQEKKLLHKYKAGAISNAEVLSFKRMAYRVSNEVGGVTKTNLSDSGKAMIIHNIISNKKNDFKFIGKSSQNIEMIETQITEFKKHCIKIEDINKAIEETKDNYLKAKLKDMSKVYEEFQKKIEGNYIEENDILTILAEQLDYTDMFKDTIIYIDEFIGFTKQEYRIIEKLLKQAKQVNITINADNLDMGTNQETDIFYLNKQTADKLLYLARNNNIECEKTIFFSENYKSKNQELKHLEKNIYETIYTRYDKNVENIQLFLANNSYSEVENVAKQIIKLVKEEKYKYKDITIVTKNLEEYSTLFKAIFNEYDIPIFIDEKKQLTQNLFIKYIISILDIFAKNWSYDSVINYIKTGFTKIDTDDIYVFENYTRKWGIKGSKWYIGEWNFKDETEENREQIEYIKELRKKIVDPLVKLKQNMQGIKTASQITKGLYEFLIENGIDKIIIKNKEMLEKEGYIEQANEQELAWNIVISLFDEIILIFGEENITFEKYLELLRVGLNNSGLGRIPQTQDKVIIGDIDRTKSGNIKVAFMLGINDGVYPTINKKEGFLNDIDRENLKNNGIELAKGTLDKIYEDRFSIYKAFMIPEEKLYLSYVSSNIDGMPLRPSVLITKIKKIFLKLEEKSDILEDKSEILTKKSTFMSLINELRKFRDGERIDEIWFQVFNYYNLEDEYKEKLSSAINALNYNNKPQELSKENIEKLYGDTLNTSVSRLEQYRSCPFSYYLKYGLKLSDKDNFKIQSIDTGTFMHETIDDFFNIVRQKELKVKELEDEEIKIIISKIIEEKLQLSKNYIFSSSDKYIVLTNRLKRVIFKSMKYIIESLRNSDFELYGNEMEFKEGKEYEPIVLNLENNKKVKITGKIDRIDIAKTIDGNYMRIIDYKSSIKNIDLNEVIAGIQIQLLTYLDATCKIEELMPAGILYFNLIDPVIKSDRPISNEYIEEELKKKFKMQGLILADVKVVKMMDKNLNVGQSQVVPAYIDKEGNLSKGRSNAVTKEQFEDLQKYTNKIIKEISEEILSGNIKLEPYYNVKNKKTPCEYCNYKSICNFNPGECGNKYKYIGRQEKEEILEQIKSKF